MNTKKIGKITYYIFLGLLGIIAALVIVSTFPITGNFKILSIRSGSMEPEIHTGSVVIVRPHESYNIGDVITFKGNGQKKVSITHRVVEMRSDRGAVSYVTKGDANNSADTRLIMQKEIIGSVMLSVPYIGYAVETVRKPYGFAALIILPAIVIILDQVGNIKKEIVRLWRKEEEVA